jgi:hypothetical protein
MPAPKGNQFWKLRAKAGRDKLFETPEKLWNAATEYFEWCDNNPLEEEKVFHSQGEITKAKVDKLRPYTLGGLCLYLDCGESYFRSFKSQDRENKKAFITVIERIEQTIYQQKFAGSAADLLNANIIARDLGLRDKSETSIVSEQPLFPDIKINLNS